MVSKAIEKLKKENRALKETCDILADKRILKNIKTSLNQIKAGKKILLSEL